MLISRVLSRISKASLAQCRTGLVISPSNQNPRFSILSSHFHSLHNSTNKLAPSQASLLKHSTLVSSFQRCGISSSASSEHNEKETTQTGSEKGTKDKGSSDAKSSDQTKESDSDSDEEMSIEDLVKLVTEKDELLKIKHKEIETMQDKVFRSYAEMENVMDRTRREAENSKKFAIQSFAKSLLDVADNLGRASTVVKESFTKIDVSKDTNEVVPLLKTLLEGVDMTDKQLAEVFKKFGVEKYDPVNEQFDPNMHNAVFQMPDASKPPGTVAAVLKPGYKLYDRVIRPAEVGVTQAVEDNEADQT